MNKELAKELIEALASCKDALATAISALYDSDYDSSGRVIQEVYAARQEAKRVLEKYPSRTLTE